jgi:hypothetical protein
MFSCGSNKFGQLGRETDATTPLLKPITVLLVELKKKALKGYLIK